jgi:hypothetical protein
MRGGLESATEIVVAHVPKASQKYFRIADSIFAFAKSLELFDLSHAGCISTPDFVRSLKLVRSLPRVDSHTR